MRLAAIVGNVFPALYLGVSGKLQRSIAAKIPAYLATRFQYPMVQEE